MHSRTTESTGGRNLQFKWVAHVCSGHELAYYHRSKMQVASLGGGGTRTRMFDKDVATLGSPDCK